MSRLPRVTIVTPSFNQAAFLQQTIDSVLAQDYSEIEYIIVDGGSRDGSVDIIRQNESHLAWWMSGRDSGQGSAINRGFAHASGNILAWLNSDDLLAPSAVRIAVDALLCDSHVGVVYGDRLHIDERGNVIGINRMPSYSPRMFRRNITLPQETVFFRRELFDQVGGIDESLHFSLDFDLWVRMSRLTQMRHIPAFLGSFREHRKSKSVNALRYRDEHERVYSKHFDRPLPGPIEMKLNRLWHKGRFTLETRSAAYRNEMARLRDLQPYRAPALQLVGGLA